jgi:hypothetical protein
MIPSATGIKRASTFTGQSIEMTIDTNSLAHIMSVLTNLYSDPEMAVLREYSCNARDSHLAVGQTRPIEITLPSNFDQYLVIEDFGLGLSIDDITDIYSRYGASTKRGTNEQTGMLGLGSKSALTYATQFTMTAVKDGVRSEVLISVKVDGSGKMEVMDTVTTNEPNGVRITIPSSPQNKFAEKASSFFQYWAEGTVLVNGEQPETIGDLTDIGDGMFITDTERSWQTREYNDIIVMGGVPYPVPSEYKSKLESVSRKYCVFYVPMGDVDFVPSREEMNLTPRTKQYLSDLIDRFIVNVGKTVATEINGCQEFPEALAVATKWRSVGNFEQKQKFTFRGLGIPLYFERKHWLYDGTYQYGSRKQSKEYRATAQKLGKAVFVHGYTSDSSPSKTIREKVWKWLENNGHDKRDIIIYSDTDFVGAWSTAIKVDYADVKATKLPTTKSVSAGTTRTYDWDTVQPNGNLKQENLPDTTKVAYYSPTALSDSDYRMSHRSKLYAIAQATGYTLVEASAGRFARLVREIPNSITAQEMVKQYITARTSVLAPRDVALYHYSSYTDVHNLKGHLDGVKDTRLIAEIDDYAFSNKTVSVVWASVRDDSRIFGEYFSQDGLLATDYELSLTQYPLLKSIMGFGDKNVDEVIVYLNAKYEMNN